MKLLQNIPILGRLINEDKGQALVFTSVVLVSFLGVTGIAVDAGKGYYAFQMLKASTNAAALAGAAGMPDTTIATTYANDYGSKSAAYNNNGIMNTVTTNPTFECLTSVLDDFYAPCEDATGGSTGTTYNAIQVTQTAKVPTWIGPLFGMPTFNIRDTATASMKGGTPTPYNIAIVLDTTASMNDPDNGTNNTANCASQIACAELGIQQFLGELVPGTASSPIDLVSLYVFPGATTTSLKNDYACNGTSPSSVPYAFTSATSLSSSTSDPTNVSMPAGDSYAVISGDTSYKSNNTTSTLNTADNLVLAVAGKSGCGAGAPGGEGTYYAQVIYQAQADLATEHTANGNANMMVILSDGDATACNTQVSIDDGSGCQGSGEYQIDVSTCPSITTANGAITSAAPCASPNTGQPINGTDYSYTTGTGVNKVTHNIQPTGYLSATYPSALGLCGQAVVAAQYATSQGTKVYTIGYGTETSGSCQTDTTYSASVTSTTNGGNTWGPGDQACAAMGAMASNSGYFFSDQYHNCDSADSNNVGITSLKQIFTRIGANISSARLIPNNAT